MEPKAMRGKLVVGNWKMHGDLRRNDALLADLRTGWDAPADREMADENLVFVRLLERRKQ